MPKDKHDFYVCIKPTVNHGEDKLGIFLCGEDEPNKYHCTEHQRVYDDMVKMANHLKVGVKAWEPKNQADMGFIPEIAVHDYWGVYFKLTNGKKNSKNGKAPAKALSITDVLAVG